MQKLMREYLNELKNRRRRRRRARIAMVILISLVVGSVIGALAQYGVAMTGNAKCGIEEHQHELACYEKTLVCTQTESEGHQHTDECYQTVTSLVCGLEESEEHTHSDACYVTEQQLICSKEEGAGHQHTDACYEEELACGKELHTHGEECYIDTDADVEDAAVWNKQYEKLEWKDTWSENLVLAAREQIGYKESSDNYTIAEDGSHKGYTRYGQFAVDTGVEAADVYADWDTAFVNFCLFYAGLSTIDIFPDKLDTVEWYEEFRKINENIDEYLSCLVAPEGYTPKAGDIVIFQKGIEEEEREYQMGIVSSYDKEKDELKVIEGNSGNEVKENDYYIEAKDAQDDEMAPVFCYLDMSGVEKAYKGTNEEPEDPVEPGEPVEPEDPEEPKDDVTEEEPKEENPDGETDGEEDPEEEDPEEETIELTTKVDGTTITLSGPASSFEEGKNYEIQAEKVEDEEMLATVEEAVEQVAEEKEKKVESFQPYDIKLLADGEQVQPLGPVEVKFSGREVVESIENEETEVNVIHVDENTGKATDMDAVATEEKDVVIETEHFSVYVYVNLEDIFGKINVTVEHWGKNIPVISGNADALTKTDTVYTNGNSTINTTIYNGEIYSADVINIPNEYYADVTSLSKICNVQSGANYDVSEVWVSNNKNNKGQGIWEGDKTIYPISSEAQIEDLKEGSIIRFIYTPKTNKPFDTKATFYDYNITDGKKYSWNSGTKKITENAQGKYLKTDNQGINALTNLTEDVSPVLLVGQHSSGNRSSKHLTDKIGEFNLNSGNSSIARGIVKDNLDKQGNLQFNVNVPQTLFKEGVGSKEYVDYTLQYTQVGDTYTLMSVYDSDNKKVLDNLATIQTKTNKNGTAYSNMFWPLDNVKNDPHMGGEAKKYYFLTGTKQGTYESGAWQFSGVNDDNPTMSYDDPKITNDRNWHFGMKTQFTFSIGDYTGPMQYYFRGDDDFWLFIDGKLAVDIGGIHSAIGQSLDVKQFMDQQGLLEYDSEGNLLDKDKEHILTVYYMERGGAGSCCFMQFTLPKAKKVEIPTPKTTEYSIHKNWKDNNNPYRPGNIQVELVQEWGPEDEKFTNDTGVLVNLNDENDWSYEWTGLPLVNGSTQGQYNYSYKVNEISLPPGYSSILINNELTNELNPSKLIIKKNWENTDGLEKYIPDKVMFRLYTQDGEYRDINSNPVDIILEKSNNWEKTINDLPQYFHYREVLDEDTGKYTYYADEIKYCIRELDDEGKVIPRVGDLVDNSGNLIPNVGELNIDLKTNETVIKETPITQLKNGAQYAITYPDGSTIVGGSGEIEVTNTLLTPFKIIKKGSDSETDLLIGAVFTLTEQTGDKFMTPKYKGVSDSKGEIQWYDYQNNIEDLKDPVQLAPGEYLMKEIVAPVGYTLSDEEWIIKIGNQEQAVISKVINGQYVSLKPIDKIESGALVLVYEYNNVILYELPSTGGPGTYWYMFSGVLLLAVTALITYRNKRKEVLRS